MLGVGRVEDLDVEFDWFGEGVVEDDDLGFSVGDGGLKHGGVCEAVGIDRRLRWRRLECFALAWRNVLGCSGGLRRIWRRHRFWRAHRAWITHGRRA